MVRDLCTTGLLLLLWPMSSQQAVYTYGGLECVFPFTYAGVTYTACTTDNSDNSYLDWCGTVPEVDDTFAFYMWGFCYGDSPPDGVIPPDIIVPPPRPEPAPTPAPEPTDAPTDAPADPTDAPVDPVAASSTIAILPENPGDDSASGCDIVYTTDGDACVFPFTYQDVTYDTCTDANHEDLWCSLDAEYDRNWGTCNLAGCVITTTAAPAEPAPSSGCAVQTTSGEDCVFPFVYQGETYTECTMINHDQYWCALSADYDRGNWADCALVVTEEGQDCVFPFLYRGEEYAACTHAYAQAAWCSLDAEYDRNWGFCQMCP